MTDPALKKGAMVGGGRAGPPGTANLFADLRKMINNPDFSDVLFRCQDGVRVCGSRMLLMARSPMLKNILSLKENRETQIALPDVSSSTFLSIVEFLYTGTLVQHAPFSSVKAYEIIRASRYFQLPQVEELVTEFLVNSTSEVADDIAKAALKLSVALDFGSSYSTGGAAGNGTANGGSNSSTVPVTLVQILNSADLKPVHLRGLSEKALRYFLHRTQTTAPPTDPGALSFGEYLRFRQIVLWCVTQICPDDAAQLVRGSVPDPRAAAALIQQNSSSSPSKRVSPSFSPSERGNVGSGYLKSILVKQPESAAVLDSLLSLVDFRRVHAELLDAVVEPLKLVPQAQLMEAFRFQAIHKRARAPQYHWEYGSSYAVATDSSVIAKIREDVGFARYAVPIFRNYGVYVWEVIVEELCVEFCEIGFHIVDGLHDGKPNFTGSTLAQQPTGFAISNDIEKGTRVNQRGAVGGAVGDGWVPFKKDFAHNNARIRVRLDMDERSCAFSVDNDDYLVAWINLPLFSVYYPAVSLGAGTLGRVRIELISGFDML